MKNNRNFSSRRAGRSSRVSLGGAWSNLLCFTGFLFCWSLEGQNELTFWRHKSCIYVFIYWQHILHTKAYKVNNMLVHQHHIFVKTSLYWSQIKLVMIWLHISKMVHRSFSWPTFGTWIIIVNMFACCNIPFCCCSYNKITRLIKKAGMSTADTQSKMSNAWWIVWCHPASNSWSSILSILLGTIGCIWNPGSEVMKGVEMVSVNPMLCMTWTQQVRTLLPPQPTHPKTTEDAFRIAVFYQPNTF